MRLGIRLGEVILVFSGALITMIIMVIKWDTVALDFLVDTIIMIKIIKRPGIVLLDFWEDIITTSKIRGNTEDEEDGQVIRYHQ